jgi:hypothetical protein
MIVGAHFLVLVVRFNVEVSIQLELSQHHACSMMYDVVPHASENSNIIICWFGRCFSKYKMSLFCEMRKVSACIIPAGPDTDRYPLEDV